MKIELTLEQIKELQKLLISGEYDIGLAGRWEWDFEEILTDKITHSENTYYLVIEPKKSDNAYDKRLQKLVEEWKSDGDSFERAGETDISSILYNCAEQLDKIRKELI